MTKSVFLDFERDIEALETKIEELRELELDAEQHKAVSITGEINQLEAKAGEMLKKVYADLTPWQISQVARHPNPRTAPIRSTTSSRSSRTFTNSTATAPTRTTRRSWAVSPVWPT